MTNSTAGDAVVARFLDECHSRGLAPATLTDRKRVLRRLAQWAEAPILFLDETQLRDWQIMQARTVQPQTLHSYLVAVRSFFSWAKARGLLDVDPAEHLDLPRLPRRLPDPIAEDVFRRCVEDAPADMAALLGLAGFAGLRAVEIARLAWPSVRWADRTLRVDGKGSKERVLPM
jgi:site-specific recombinase XerD